MPLLRSYPDPLTEHFLRETLLHNVTVEVVVGQDDCAAPQYGAPMANVRCYITGSQRRIITQEGTTVQATWEILFDRGALIGINARLTNGVDRDGRPLLSSAVIASLDPTISPDRGVEGQMAFCTPL